MERYRTPGYILVLVVLVAALAGCVDPLDGASYDNPFDPAHSESPFRYEVQPVDGVGEISASGDTVDISWDEVQGALGYEVQWTSTDSFDSSPESTDGATISLDVPNDSTIQWRVRYLAEATLPGEAEPASARSRWYGPWSFHVNQEATAELEQIAPPQFTPAGGTFQSDLHVTIFTETAGTTIYYTTDGSEPTTSSDPYTGPIPVVGDGTVVTIKGIAMLDGSESPVSQATYTVNYDTENATMEFAIGDIGPAGGYIFYEDEVDGVDDIPGIRYLEVAPVETEWAGKAWGRAGTDIAGPDIGATPPARAGLGQGALNTEAIVTAFGDGDPDQGVSDYAAKLCWDLGYNGYNDWVLPSQDELNLIYRNLASVGIGGFAAEQYWSSSESDADDAWSVDFAAGTVGTGGKEDGRRVRAIRYVPEAAGNDDHADTGDDPANPDSEPATPIGAAAAGTVVEFKIPADSFGGFVTKAFEPMTYNADGTTYLNPTTSFQEDLSTLPEASITVDGNPQEWPSNKWMIEDTYHSDPNLGAGADLSEFWLVRDGDSLAGAFVLTDNAPNTNLQYVLHMADQMGFGSGSPGYFVRYYEGEWVVTYRSGEF